jgi:hypothetical protein
MYRKNRYVKLKVGNPSMRTKPLNLLGIYILRFAILNNTWIVLSMVEFYLRGYLSMIPYWQAQYE